MSKVALFTHFLPFSPNKHQLSKYSHTYSYYLLIYGLLIM